MHFLSALAVLCTSSSFLVFGQETEQQAKKLLPQVMNDTESYPACLVDEDCFKTHKLDDG